MQSIAPLMPDLIEVQAFVSEIAVKVPLLRKLAMHSPDSSSPDPKLMVTALRWVAFCRSATALIQCLSHCCFTAYAGACAIASGQPYLGLWICLEFWPALPLKLYQCLWKRPAPLPRMLQPVSLQLPVHPAGPELQAMPHWSRTPCC